LSATNRVLASRAIGPVGRTRRADFAPRAGSGMLPAGTAAPVRQPAPPTPPPAQVPGYQHVFLFYFENEDYSQIVGNTSRPRI
jgi:hypothetical protein